MNIIQKLKLAKRLNNAADEFDEGMKMKSSTKVIGAVIAGLTAFLEIPSVNDAIASFFSHHGAVLVAIVGIIKVLLLVHDPVKGESVVGSNLKSQGGRIAYSPLVAVLVVSVLLLFALSAVAQAPVPIQNLYAAGASFNNGASPAVAGTALYAHQVADVGTYAFTVADFVPASIKPFTVTSNIGVGVAQRAFTIGKIPIFVPTSAGISFSGSNTGWSWSAGGMAAIRVKDNWRVLPAIRVVKSSVSNGAGYQPIVSVLFGWGQ